MRRSRFTDEQMVKILREADKKPVAEVFILTRFLHSGPHPGQEARPGPLTASGGP